MSSIAKNTFALLSLVLTISACQKKNEGPQKSVLGYATCKNGTLYEFNPTNGIIGGRKVAPDEDIAKGTVFLAFSYVDSKYQYFRICSGTLIDRNIVLTAAHCVYQARHSYSSSLRVYFTNEPICDQDTNTLASESRGVSDLRIHQAWRPDDDASKGDIAVLKLRSAAPATALDFSLVDPVGTLQESTEFIAAGFGRTTDLKPGVATAEDTHPINLKTTRLYWPDRDLRKEAIPELRKEKQTGLENALGKKPTPEEIVQLVPDNYLDFNPANESLYVDQTRGSSVCRGDSGGPLYVSLYGQKYVVGVTSKAIAPDPDRTGLCSYIASYANVGYYKSWIEKSFSAMKSSATTKSTPFVKP